MAVIKKLIEENADQSPYGRRMARLILNLEELDLEWPDIDIELHSLKTSFKKGVWRNSCEY